MDYFEANRMGSTFLPMCRQLITAPRALFRDMAGTAYYRDGIALITIVVLIASILSVAFSGFAMLFMVPFVWGFILISTWFLAAYLSWAVGVMSECKLTTTNAFLLLAYASVPLVLSLVPVVAVIAGLWSLALVWLGLVARAGLSPVKATMILSLPVAVLVSLVAALMLLVIPHLYVSM